MSALASAVGTEIPPSLKVLVTGATGFVGRHVCARLAADGFAVRALVRRGSNRSALEGHVHDFFPGTVSDAGSLTGAAEGCFAVVHLVGIINEAEGSFEAIHVEGTRSVVAEAQRAGAKRMVYLSGLGARPDAAARYHKTKYAAEQIVAQSGMEGYNFPASIIFGPEDEFVNLFIKFASNLVDPRYPPWPIMPVIGGGHTVLQPIWVEDVAEVLSRACRPEFPQTFPPGTYELGGPEPLTVKQIMRVACRAAGRERIFVPVPMAVARILATVMEKVSRRPLLTRDQLQMLSEDGRARQNAAPKILGREPRKLWDYAREQFRIDSGSPDTGQSSRG